MSLVRSSLLVFLIASANLFAEAPPAPPLPAPFAARGEMVRSGRWVLASQSATNAPDQQTEVMTLSAGITLISMPVIADSYVLADLLQPDLRLPPGSRVWTWDPFNQQFVEGFDQQLQPGQGALLYVPLPTILTITGSIDNST